MARDDALRLLTSEFNLWGVKVRHYERDSGHIELLWQATPDKEVRSYTIAKTPSDHRGWLNARAHIRRLFRHDGLTLKSEKKRPILHKALTLPEPVESDPDQLKMLRAEVADLTEMVMELVRRLDHVAATPAAAPVAAAPVAAPPVVARPTIVAARGTERQPFRSVNAIDYVSQGWNSIEAIARDMGVPVTIAYRKLYYLMRKGLLQKSGERWRRTRETIAAVA